MSKNNNSNQPEVVPFSFVITTFILAIIYSPLKRVLSPYLSLGLNNGYLLVFVQLLYPIVSVILFFGLFLQF